MEHQYTKKRLLHDLGSYINPYLDAGDDVSRKDKLSLVEEEKCILSAMSSNMWSWSKVCIDRYQVPLTLWSRMYRNNATKKLADKMIKDEIRNIKLMCGMDRKTLD